jgi:hypothetical protein
MEVSGQFHDLAGLPPGIERLVPIRQEDGWVLPVLFTIKFL